MTANNRVELNSVELSRDWNAWLNQATDQLDQLAMAEVAKRAPGADAPEVLQVDCGDARLGMRLAKMGANVLAVDRSSDVGNSLIAPIDALGVARRIRFGEWNPEQCMAGTLPEGAPFDLIICNNTLSAYPYRQAHDMLRCLSSITRIGGKLFLSAYGIHSELGESYVDEGKPVRQRFAPLSASIADKYGISAPVCLYSERDLFLLLFEAGLTVVRTFTTTHGNVKAVAVRV
jgi:hypothetical protein